MMENAGVTYNLIIKGIRMIINSLFDMKAIQIILILLAGLSVAIADIFIKKIAKAGTFMEALTQPVILLVVALYLAQIVFFLFVFMKKWDLSVVGILHIIFYATTVVAVGVIYFREDISLIQGIGIGLGLLGVILMIL
jgi:drug/metabolite transporter (DMT)-like permease